jgi:hypothetical protein
MHRTYAQWLEVAANAAIVLIAGAILATLVWPNVRQRGTPPRAEQEVKVGERLSITDVDWRVGSSTLVLVFRRDCGFCVQSVPFYQKLSRAASEAGVQLVALFPPPIKDANEFLESEGVRPNVVKAVTDAEPRLTKSPMLLLVNQSGTVERVWGGKLPETLHSVIMQAIQAKGARTEP